MQKDLSARQSGDEEMNKTEGYPLYPEIEDIYRKCHEEKNLDPDTISQIENSANPEEYIISEETDFNSALIGNHADAYDLVLVDYQDNNGNEDEENNYFSLGGDDHEDLEEAQYE